MHNNLASYIAEITEAEENISVERGVATNRPDFNCIVQREGLPFESDAPDRTLSETRRMISFHNDGEENIESKFKCNPFYPCHLS